MAALGMIEVYGFATSIVVADAVAKAADVQVVAIDRNKPANADQCEVPLVMIVKFEGNPAAVRIINEVMTACDAEWRGLGIIPGSGLKLNETYSRFDARLKFNVPEISGTPHAGCRCGEILQGLLKPEQCPLFGKVCTPLKPVGACMVSHEGACSAYYQYGR